VSTRSQTTHWRTSLKTSTDCKTMPAKRRSKPAKKVKRKPKRGKALSNPKKIKTSTKLHAVGVAATLDSVLHPKASVLLLPTAATAHLVALALGHLGYGLTPKVGRLAARSLRDRAPLKRKKRTVRRKPAKKVQPRGGHFGYHGHYWGNQNRHDFDHS